MNSNPKCLWHCCSTFSNVYQSKFCSRKCKNKFYVDKRRKELKIKAIEYKGGKCEICNYNSCIAALDFHHVDPSQKEFRISNGNTYNWEKIKKELDKCELLCANCHRQVHYNFEKNGSPTWI